MTQQSHPNDRPAAKDELLTISEVAAIVRVPIATLRYWRHLGTGPRSVRIGRGVRYWNNDLTTWLQSQSDGPPPYASSACQRRRRTRQVATSPPGRSLPWKHKVRRGTTS